MGLSTILSILQTFDVKNKLVILVLFSPRFIDEGTEMQRGRTLPVSPSPRHRLLKLTLCENYELDLSLIRGNWSAEFMCMPC